SSAPGEEWIHSGCAARFWNWVTVTPWSAGCRIQTMGSDWTGPLAPDTVPACTSAWHLPPDTNPIGMTATGQCCSVQHPVPLQLQPRTILESLPGNPHAGAAQSLRHLALVA